MPPIVRSDGSMPTRSEKGRATAIFNRLRRRYPDIHTALSYENPWQLLVVTVLSAQTTDENVNRTAPALFARYPTPQALAEADPEEVESLVYSTGFYRQKTESIIALSVDLVERHRGEVPASLDELVPLRGVGRKTASVVLAEAFGQPAIAVDTHVRRVSNRLGLTNGQNPLKIEQDLKAVFPRSNWSKLSMSIIQFGRDVCTARSPRCPECELARLCPWPYKTAPGPDNSGPDNAGPDTPGPDNAGPDNAGPDTPGPDTPGPDTPGQNNAGMTPPTEAAPAG
ncbi:MAG TPA: endonuclease III [Acidimicrobiia bacterium]|nr:endonuclease III [Acidimicrobiia bacterium]